MALGVYGKHPSRGDFLEYGLPAGLRAQLEGWLDATLAVARADLGAEWEYRWAGAPMLRFWLGEAVWGQPVVGVMAATQDRVGRRFPLVLLATGDGLAPPAVDPAQDWYRATEAHLAAVLAQGELSGPAALIEGMVEPAPVTVPAGPADFWAVRDGAALTELWADVALTDHRRAAAGRSYWWVAGRDRSDEVPPERPPDADDTDPSPADLAEADLAAPAEETLAADDAWAEAEPVMHDDSPFAAPAGPSLFAPPEPGQSRLDAPVVAAAIPRPSPRLAFSQVWAGPGLPSGQVIAWFLRGFQQNG